MKKSDLNKIIGTWYCEENDWEIKFYEPDDDDTSGDFEVIENGEYVEGEYEWHKSSKKIELVRTYSTLGMKESITYRYEIVDDNCLILTNTENESKQITFQKVETKEGEFPGTWYWNALEMTLKFYESKDSSVTGIVKLQKDGEWITGQYIVDEENKTIEFAGKDIWGSYDNAVFSYLFSKEDELELIPAEGTPWKEILYAYYPDYVLQRVTYE